MKNITTLYNIKRFTDQCFDRDNDKVAAIIKGYNCMLLIHQILLGSCFFQWQAIDFLENRGHLRARLCHW